MPHPHYGSIEIRTTPDALVPEPCPVCGKPCNLSQIFGLVAGERSLQIPIACATCLVTGLQWAARQALAAHPILSGNSGQI